jgi:casein kinase II subunit beta
VEMDRKRIKDAFEKHLERSSPSTSRGTTKERERLSAGKLPAVLGKAGKLPDVGKSLARSRSFIVVFLSG